MKELLKNFRIPKTFIGICFIAAGIYFNEEKLVTVGLAIMGVGISSKIIKTAQGKDPFAHEKIILKGGKYNGK